MKETIETIIVLLITVTTSLFVLKIGLLIGEFIGPWLYKFLTL